APRPARAARGGGGGGKRLGGEGAIAPHKAGGWRGGLVGGYPPRGDPAVRPGLGAAPEARAGERGGPRRPPPAPRTGTPAGAPARREDHRDAGAGLLAAWLEPRQPVLRPRTHERYAQLVRLHLVPALGATRLAALRAEQLDRLYLARLKAGSTPRTVLLLHR